MLIAVKKDKVIVLFIIIFGTLSFPDDRTESMKLVGSVTAVRRGLDSVTVRTAPSNCPEDDCTHPRISPRQHSADVGLIQRTVHILLDDFIAGL